MDELLIPVAKTRRQLGFALILLAALHLRKQETKLLSEGVQQLPPVAAAVLVHVADEDLVQELVDVE